MDIRSKMYGKVFLSGGTCSAPGFGERVEWELNQIIEKEFRGLADPMIPEDERNKPTAKVVIPESLQRVREAVYEGALKLPELVGFQELFMKRESSNGEPSEPHHVWHFADVRPNRHLLHNDKFRVWTDMSGNQEMGIKDFHNDAHSFEQGYFNSQEAYDSGDRPGQYWSKEDDAEEEPEEPEEEEDQSSLLSRLSVPNASAAANAALAPNASWAPNASSATNSTLALGTNPATNAALAPNASSLFNVTKAEVPALSESLVEIGAMLGSATDHLAEAVYDIIPPTSGLDTVKRSDV